MPADGTDGRQSGQVTRTARWAAALVAAAAPFALAGCGGSPAALPPAPACTTSVAGSADVVLDPEQAANAATIAAVGKRLGFADHAVTVAIATAMQESKLRNLTYGDRDSLGLFQQRPSQGWGRPDQIAVPAYAATAFFTRLKGVKGWQDLPVTVAAQAVQRSAYPEAYGAQEGAARALAQATTGEVPAALACAHLTGPGPLRTADLQRDAGAELGGAGLGATGGAALWTAASWVVAHADTYGVRTVTADGRRWTATTGRWVPEPGAGSALAYS